MFANAGGYGAHKRGQHQNPNTGSRVDSYKNLKTRGKISPSGNRTRVSRVTGADTHHYTNEDLIEVILKVTDFKVFRLLYLSTVYGTSPQAQGRFSTRKKPNLNVS